MNIILVLMTVLNVGTGSSILSVGCDGSEYRGTNKPKKKLKRCYK